MNVAKLLYDPKCYELAEYFLPDGAEERLKNSLAYEIQTSVEDWLQENEVTEEYPGEVTDPGQTSGPNS